MHGCHNLRITQSSLIILKISFEFFERHRLGLRCFVKLMLVVTFILCNCYSNYVICFVDGKCKKIVEVSSNVIKIYSGFTKNSDLFIHWLRLVSFCFNLYFVKFLGSNNYMVPHYIGKVWINSRFERTQDNIEIITKTHENKGIHFFA